MTTPGASTKARASPSGGDVPACVAAPACSRHLESEHLAQDARRRVSVQLFHVHLPVGPNRSVLIRSGAWPRSTSADATDSTNDVGPHTNTRGSSSGREPDLAQQRSVRAPGAYAFAPLAREREDDVVAE